MKRAKRLICAALCFVMLTGAIFLSGCSLPFGLGSLHVGDTTPVPVLTPAGNAPSPTPGEADPHPARTVLDVSAVPADLVQFLAQFGWYGYSAPVYDPAALPDGGVLGSWFRLCVDYDLYPGPAAETLYAPDPQNRWTSCLVLDAEKTEWILRNILRYDEAGIQAARGGAAVDPSLAAYRSGDRYYVPFGGVGGGFEVYPLYAETDGVTVYITYASYAGDGYYSFSGIHYAEVSDMALDGGVFWTLGYWTSQPPAPSLPAGADPAAFTGDWTSTGGGTLKVTGAGSQLQLTASFPGKAGFTAAGTLQSDGRTCVFGASDGSGFSGAATLTDAGLALRVIPVPQMTGKPYDGFFRAPIAFPRSSAAPGTSQGGAGGAYDVPALVTQIDGWRSAPGSGDRTLYEPLGETEIPYYRTYFFHDNALVYAFLYNSDGSIEIYYSDGEPIRYTDSGTGTRDYGAVTQEETGVAAQVIADAYWHYYNNEDDASGGDVDVSDLCDQIESRYMNPRPEDDIVTVPIWELEWPYNRTYLFLYGELAYALLYNDSDTIVMYFYSDDLIRYVDQYGQITDLGDLTEDQLSLSQSVVADAYWFYYGAGADGKGEDEEGGTVADAVSFIQDHYYNPRPEDDSVYVPIWTLEWPYHREYLFIDGMLAFAYLYNDTDSIRLYYFGGGLVRYIDASGTVTDSPNLTTDMLSFGAQVEADANTAMYGAG